MDRTSKAHFNTVLTWLLAALLIASLAGVVYLSLTPGAEEDPYTEFYILGPDGNASDYPTNLSTGETGEVIVGITNNEHKIMTYTVVLMLDGDPVAKQTTEVTEGRTWEDVFRFESDEAGVKQLDVLLYLGEDPDFDDEPYRSLELVVDINKVD